MNMIFKICPSGLWQTTDATGKFTGAAVDHEDGYIHFSTKSQVRETADKHFAGQKDLLLIAVATASLGDRLRWEPSRGGDLFPHLYGELDVSDAVWIKPLPLGSDGHHEFPEMTV